MSGIEVLSCDSVLCAGLHAKMRLGATVQSDTCNDGPIFNEKEADMQNSGVNSDAASQLGYIVACNVLLRLTFTLVKFTCFPPVRCPYCQVSGTDKPICTVGQCDQVTK